MPPEDICASFHSPDEETLSSSYRWSPEKGRHPSTAVSGSPAPCIRHALGIDRRARWQAACPRELTVCRERLTANKAFNEPIT